MKAKSTAFMLVAATLLTLAAGHLLKRPCVEGSWGAPRHIEYSTYCYNDFQPMYHGQSWDKPGFPYVRRAGAEYPPLIALQSWLAAQVVRSHQDFYRVNALINAGLALVTLGALMVACGARRRIFWFASGAPLFLYAFLNWDLSTLAGIAAAAAFWRRSRRPFLWTSLALGVATCGKLFPVLAMPAIGVAALRAAPERRMAALADVVLGFAIGWGGVNLPLIIADFVANGDLDGWLGMFAFQAQRNPDFTTLWHWALQHVSASDAAKKTVVDTIFAASVLLGMGFFLSRLARGRIGAWPAAAGTIAICMAMAKVFSPQYAIWILPLLVILPVPLPLMAGYALADVSAFFTTFSVIGARFVKSELPLDELHVAAIGVRTVMLLSLAVWLARCPGDGLISGEGDATRQVAT